MPNHKDIQRGYLEQDGKILNAASRGALWYSFQILRKTSFYGRLEDLKYYNQEFKKYKRNSYCSHDDLRINKLANALEKRKVLYNGVGDDLLALAAFENFMCSMLLKGGFLIHKIKDNKALSKRLNSEKLHCAELNAYGDFNFLDITINGSVLLKPNYVDIVDISEIQINGIKDLKDRRNKAHFDSQVYSVPVFDDEFFAALDFIEKSIEREVKIIWPDRV